MRDRLARGYPEVMFLLDQQPRHPFAGRATKHPRRALVCAFFSLALSAGAQPPTNPAPTTPPTGEPPVLESPATEPPATNTPPTSPSTDDKFSNRRSSLRVYHLRLEGDFDCSALVDALRARLEDAAAKKCGMIILELSGDRWRPDITRDLAFTLRDSGLRSVVVLNDPRDHHVGAGALALGLLADQLYIERGTSVLATPDHIAADLAPESADLEKGTRELSGALHVALSPRALESLAWMIADPTRETLEKPLYITPASAVAPASLTNSPPAPANQPGVKLPTPVIKPPANSSDRGVSIELSPDDLSRLDLATPVRGMANIAPGSGTRLAPVSLRVSLDDARGKAAECLAAADHSLASAEKALDLDWPRDPTVSRDAYQKAATSAARDLDSVAASLATLESLLGEYPELTRTPAPGQTSVAGKPSAYAVRWKREAQSRADDLTKLREKARLFASQ